MEQDFELPTFRPKHLQELIIPSFEVGDAIIELNSFETPLAKADRSIPDFKTLDEKEDIENIKIKTQTAKDGFDASKVNPMLRVGWSNAGFEDSTFKKKKAGVLEEREKISEGMTSPGGVGLYTGMGKNFYEQSQEELSWSNLFGGDFWKNDVLKPLDDAAKSILGFEGDWNSGEAWAQWGKKTGASIMEMGSDADDRRDWIREGAYGAFSTRNSYSASVSSKKSGRPRSRGGYKAPKILQQSELSEVAEFVTNSKDHIVNLNTGIYEGLVVTHNSYLTYFSGDQGLTEIKDKGGYGQDIKISGPHLVKAYGGNSEKFSKLNAYKDGPNADTVKNLNEGKFDAGKDDSGLTDERISFNTALSQIIRSRDLQSHYYIAWFTQDDSIYIGDRGTALFYVDKFSVGKLTPGDVIKKSYGFVDVGLNTEGASKGDSKISFELLETAFMDVRDVLKERTGVKKNQGHIGDPGKYKVNEQDNDLDLHIVSPIGMVEGDDGKDKLLVMHITSKDLRLIKLPGVNFSHSLEAPKPIKLEFTCRGSYMKIETI